MLWQTLPFTTAMACKDLFPRLTYVSVPMEPMVAWIGDPFFEDCRRIWQTSRAMERAETEDTRFTLSPEALYR